MCAGTLVHYDQTARERVARPGTMVRRVCPDPLVHYDQTVRARVGRPGRRVRRVCPCTPVHYDETARAGVAAALARGVRLAAAHHRAARGHRGVRPLGGSPPRPHRRGYAPRASRGRASHAIPCTPQRKPPYKASAPRPPFSHQRKPPQREPPDTASPHHLNVSHLTRVT